MLFQSINVNENVCEDYTTTQLTSLILIPVCVCVESVVGQRSLEKEGLREEDYFTIS